MYLTYLLAAALLAVSVGSILFRRHRVLRARLTDDYDVRGLLRLHALVLGSAVMMAAAVVQDQPVQVMQGIMVPASSVDPKQFFAHTRRLTFPMVANRAIAGAGASDLLTLTQTGIIATLLIKVVGSVTITPGTGTVASTYKWPYDLIRALRVTANGQANLVNVSGRWLKARELMRNEDLTDSSVSNAIGGAYPGTARTNSTLSMRNEAWGVGQQVTGIANGTYNFELYYVVPLAFDERTLVGSIFAQTASTELSCNIDWAPVSDLFTLTGNAAASYTGTISLEGVVYSIPEVNGQIIVPNLSAFHSLISGRTPAIANGDNEYPLPGQGVGRQLMRLMFSTYNGAGVGVPLPVNRTNYGQVGWRFGGNDTPEVFTDGTHLALWDERLFGVDFATLQGIGVLDFCDEFVLRDSIDEGLATNLRLLANIQNGVSLATPVLEVVQETLFGATAGA
jgi:hypothetical protein